MKDYLKCSILCLGVGMVIGAVVVAKNKPLANKINQKAIKAELELNEFKQGLEQKIEEIQDAMQQAKEDMKSNNNASQQSQNAKKKN